MKILHGTAGLILFCGVLLSLFYIRPQNLFWLAQLRDSEERYQQARGIVRRRIRVLLEGLDLNLDENPLYDAY